MIVAVIQTELMAHPTIRMLTAPLLLLALGCTNQRSNISGQQADSGSPVMEAQTEKVSIDVDSHIQKIRNSDFLGKHELFRKLFEFADDDVLSSLLENKNDSIAVQSAWEIAIRKIPIEGDRPPYRPDPALTESFLDTLAQRFRTQIPDWWRDVVTKCGANSRFNVYSGDPKVDPYHAVSKDRRFGTLIECPRDHQFTETEDGFLYVAGADEVLLPKSLFDSHRNSSGKLFGHASGLFTDSCFFFAFHKNHGDPFDLICLDRLSGTTKWTTTICGSSWNSMGSYLGDPKTWATMEAGEGDQIVVFGACPHGFFAHSINQNNGETLAEFSGGY